MIDNVASRKSRSGTASRAPQRIVNASLALACVAALIASAAGFQQDRARRVADNQFVKRYQLDMRRPEVGRTLAYAPSEDWSAGILADAALKDTFEVTDLTNASAALREAWISASQLLDDELRDSQSLLLHAIADRPGWPFYQSLLGQATFARLSRNLSPDLVGRPELWSRPMLNAARNASGVPHLWRVLAAMYLRTWPVLAGVHEATSNEVFGHAFEEPYFVIAGFADAAALLGPDRAIGYIGDSPISLRSVFDRLSAANDTARAWKVFRRWEQTEWTSRVRDFASIEERHAQRDPVGVRFEGERWLRNHPPWDFDTPGAHAQAARLLDIWPTGHRGRWATDPLVDVVRYLLSRSDAGRFRGSAQRYLAGFSDAPGDVVATDTTTDASVGESICGNGGLIAPQAEGRVSLRLTALEPTIAEVRVNRARAATVLVDGAATIEVDTKVPLQKTLSLRILSGDPNSCMTVVTAAPIL
jgi:hypothetical protein